MTLGPLKRAAESGAHCTRARYVRSRSKNHKKRGLSDHSVNVAQPARRIAIIRGIRFKRHHFYHALLGDGWRLPTDDEWRQMAKHYGGLGNDSPDKGKATYMALVSGGTSGFNAVLGGNRSIDGQYDRLEAHGLYWTASENDAITAPFYNFGKGSQALYRQPQGQKQMALSVRCVRQ